MESIDNIKPSGDAAIIHAPVCPVYEDRNAVREGHPLSIQLIEGVASEQS